MYIFALFTYLFSSLSPAILGIKNIKVNVKGYAVSLLDLAILW